MAGHVFHRTTRSALPTVVGGHGIELITSDGRRFIDACGGPVRFNGRDTRHGPLAAAADDSLKAVLQDALVRVYGCPPETAAAASDLEGRIP